MFALDGNIVDMAAATGGVVVPLVKALKTWWCNSIEHLSKDKIIVDVFNGVMIAPFVMMILSVFSNDMMKLLMESSKLTIAIGGFAGLIFVSAELSK
jgi:hypothetical protein